MDVIEGRSIGDKIVVKESDVRQIVTSAGKTVDINIIDIPNSDDVALGEVFINRTPMDSDGFNLFCRAAKDSSILTDEVATPPTTKQSVLPETVSMMIQEVEDDVIGGDLTEQLLATKFIAHEVRDRDDVPDINIFEPGKMEDSDEQLCEDLLGKLSRIIDFLGMNMDQVSPGAILIDPVDVRFKNAQAFLHVTTNRIWVKMDDLTTFDHEAAHWIVNAFPTDEGLHRGNLVNEGLASWIAWNVKSVEEQESSVLENYHKGVEVWATVFDEKDIHLDMEIHNIPAMAVGANLWQVVSESVGNNQKLMQHWMKIDNFKSVREWITSMSLDPDQVEENWKALVFK